MDLVSCLRSVQGCCSNRAPKDVLLQAAALATSLQSIRAAMKLDADKLLSASSHLDSRTPASRWCFLTAGTIQDLLGSLARLHLSARSRALIRHSQPTTEVQLL